MSKNEILITGSNGLIGSALKEQLQKIGIEAKGLDISCMATQPDYGNIQNLELLKRIAAGCVGIVHLAAVSRVISGEKNPQLCWNTNVEGTRNVLEAANYSPYNPWVIYASSREVYGQQTTLPVTEKVPLLPLNAYAHSKVTAEKLVAEYRKQGLQTATLRFSNVYGSIYDYADRVIPAFCKTAAWGGTMRIDGSDSTFDFTYIDDVVAGIIKVIDKLQAGLTDLPTLHFTTGQGTTLRQAAQLASSYSEYSINFIEAPSRFFDVSKFYGDPSLANQLLGWKAKISIQEGVKQFIDQFKSQAEPATTDNAILCKY